VEVGELILAEPQSDQRSAERLELLGDLYEALRREERFERALEVVQLRNASGWRGRPDGRCDEAEMLLRVGKRAEALALFEQCWEAGEEPWWVANNAGLAFGDASEHELAVDWLGRGIETAMAGGDPERLVVQMCDLRRASLERLGRPVDGVQRDGEAFADRARRRRSAHEDRTRMITDAIAGSEGAGPAVIAMAWFPSWEYERALALWPDALERFAGVAHRDYCRAMEVDMRALTSAGIRVSHVAPVTVAALTAHAGTVAVDPASPAARAGLAAERVRQGEATSWPPGRNDRCWCRRPVKYKRCCGAVDADPADVRDTAAAARMLRRLTAGPAVPDIVDARRGSPTAAIRAELDQFGANSGAAQDGPNPELEDEFDDLVSDGLYPHLLELARRSPDAPLDQLLNEVAEALGHDVVRGSIRRDAAVRLSLAEAIAAEGRPEVASELAQGVLAALQAAGERPGPIAIAVATTYLVDINHVEEAVRRYRTLLTDRPDEAGLIGEIAGDALCHRGYDLEALPWLTVALESALEAPAPARRDVQAAVARLRRTWAMAAIEPDEALIHRAADALGVEKQP
jgi:tetratricopeptide (TPR) repeat protein